MFDVAVLIWIDARVAETEATLEVGELALLEWIAADGWGEDETTELNDNVGVLLGTVAGAAALEETKLSADFANITRLTLGTVLETVRQNSTSQLMGKERFSLLDVIVL